MRSVCYHLLSVEVFLLKLQGGLGKGAQRHLQLYRKKDVDENRGKGDMTRKVNQGFEVDSMCE